MLRAGDAEAARSVMAQHMQQAEAYMVELDAELDGTWLGPPQTRDGPGVILDGLDVSRRPMSKAARS